MREIKFRAWDGEKLINDVTPWRWDFVIENSWYKCEKSTGNGVLGTGGEYAEMLVPAKRFKVLMQYTGLKDKNGVEIYDGDIDKSGNVIKWNSEKAMFALYSKENRLMSWPLFGKEIEVIGNIHSNPELLK